MQLKPSLTNAPVEQHTTTKTILSSCNQNIFKIRIDPIQVKKVNNDKMAITHEKFEYNQSNSNELKLNEDNNCKELDLEVKEFPPLNNEKNIKSISKNNNTNNKQRIDKTLISNIISQLNNNQIFKSNQHDNDNSIDDYLGKKRSANPSSTFCNNLYNACHNQHSCPCMMSNNSCSNNNNNINFNNSNNIASYDNVYNNIHYLNTNNQFNTNNMNSSLILALKLIKNNNLDNILSKFNYFEANKQATSQHTRVNNHNAGDFLNINKNNNTNCNKILELLSNNSHKKVNINNNILNNNNNNININSEEQLSNFNQRMNTNREMNSSKNLSLDALSKLLNASLNSDPSNEFKNIFFNKNK